MGKQVINTVIGSKEYIIENTGNMGVTLTDYNGKVYLNGMEVPNETGVWNVKSLQGVKLTIREAKIKKSVLNNFSFRSNVSQSYSDKVNFQEGLDLDKNKINLSKNDNESRMMADSDRLKVIQDDYMMSGMNQRLSGYNIEVKGDIVVSGMNNVVRKGKLDRSLPNLIIKGDLVISGMNNSVKTIVVCKGDIVNSGMSNRII